LIIAQNGYYLTLIKVKNSIDLNIFFLKKKCRKRIKSVSQRCLALSKSTSSKVS
jgi:hypothetical protein